MKNLIILTGMLVVALALTVDAGEITVGKTEPTGKYHIGETIHYKMYIANPSAVPLRIEKTWDDFAEGTAGHIHTEPVPPHMPIFTLAPNGQPGDRVDYDYYELVTSECVNANNQVTNVFWAEGYNEYPEGEEFAQGQGVETVDILLPCIKVTKEVKPDVSKIGDMVLYTIKVCNCSETDTDLMLVSFEDNILGDLSGSYSPVLPVGECEIRSFEYTIKDTDPDPLENTVKVVYEDETGFDVSDTDHADVDLVEVCIKITKDVEPSVAEVGETVLYTICIENCEEWGLEHVVVEDPLLGGILGVFPDVLEPYEVVCVDFPYVIQPEDPPQVDNCAKVESDPVGPMMNPVDDRDCARVTIPVGEEGCTPGFWKNNAAKHDASAWCKAYSPSEDFSDIFGIPEQELRDKGKDVFSNPTLLEALSANGGGINALARHAVAALLNACSGCVEYPMSMCEIITEVQEAIAMDGDAIDALHIKLAGYNEAGCPVNQHGECNGD